MTFNYPGIGMIGKRFRCFTKVLARGQSSHQYRQGPMNLNSSSMENGNTQSAILLSVSTRCPSTTCVMSFQNPTLAHQTALLRPPKIVDLRVVIPVQAPPVLTPMDRERKKAVGFFPRNDFLLIIPISRKTPYAILLSPFSFFP